MTPPDLASVAIRVHHMQAMVAFYSEAFGASFRELDTFGLRSRFGEVAGIMLKLVPIREAADFEGFPVHQLGFNVTDVQSVLAAAERHGGRPEGDVLERERVMQAALSKIPRRGARPGWEHDRDLFTASLGAFGIGP